MGKAQAGGANGDMARARKPHSAAVPCPSIHHRWWSRSITADDDNTRAAPKLTSDASDFFVLGWNHQNKKCASFRIGSWRHSEAVACAAAVRREVFVRPQMKSPGIAPGLGFKRSLSD